MRDAMERLGDDARTMGKTVHITQIVEAVIEDCGGDPRAAVLTLLKVNHALMKELQALTGRRSHERALGPQ